MAKPLVSILINNYNYCDFLADAVDSALNQSYGNVEVVVVDDGSTDGSRELLERYQGQVVTVLKENGGQASAFNAGFKASSGEILCFLDADDYFRHDKIEKIVDLFHEHPDSGWLVHRLLHVDGEKRPTSIKELAGAPRFAASGDYRVIARSGKDRDLPVLPATSALCFRRELLRAILPVPSALRITADNFLKSAALLTSPLVAVDEQFAFQRIHGSNAYSNVDRKEARFRKVSRQINREIALGLYNLDSAQGYSRRLALRNLKTSLCDSDFGDLAVSVKDVIHYSLRGR